MGGGADTGLRVAIAQGPSPDPTPGNPILCADLQTPPLPTGNLVCTYTPPNPIPQAALPGQNYTWIPPSTTPVLPWTPYREPAIFIQMWNGSYSRNPYGTNPWWGVNQSPTNTTDAPPADVPRDVGRLALDNQGQPYILPDGNNGITDQWEIMKWYLDLYYTQYGFRRFIFKLPAGAVWDQDFTVNQWQLMPAWKQDFFANPNSPLNLWKNGNPNAVPPIPPKPGVQFEVYVGGLLPLGMCTPCFTSNTFGGSNAVLNQSRGVQTGTTPQGQPIYEWRIQCPGVPTAQQFVPWDQRHVNMYVEALRPWMLAGFKGAWMDALNENERIPVPGQPGGRVNAQRRRGLLELAYMPIFRTVPTTLRIGDETFPERLTPIPGGGNAETIDDCAVAYTRWFGVSKVATNWVHDHPDPNQRRQFKNISDGWLFDRTKSEVVLALIQADRLVNGTPVTETPWTYDQVKAARERGFVLSLYNVLKDGAFDSKTTAGYMQRWYSMGKIYVVDFDGDGVVADPEDKNKFEAAYNASFGNNSILPVFANGDVNGITSPGNAPVNTDDLIFFNFYWNRYKAGLFDTNIDFYDYGGADAP